jgi:plastocyanin
MALAAVVAGCGGSSGYGGGGGGGGTQCTAANATAVTTVTMAGFQFVPSCIRIAPGATITFDNTDTMTHTVTTDAGQPETFDHTLTAGQNVSQPFKNQPETVHIHCNIHAGMTATIFVE